MSAASSRVSWLVFGLALGGCAQAVGEVCQIDDDCEGDLVCCDDTGSAPTGSERGTCTVGMCTRIRVDGGPPGTDAATDAAPRLDARADGSVDAPMLSDVPAADDATADAEVGDAPVSDGAASDAEAGDGAVDSGEAVDGGADASSVDSGII